MTENAPTATTAPPISTVSPEELTALVARLHERSDAMTTTDVAGALGLDERDVAAALAELRRSRTATPPSIAKAPKRTPRAFLLALALIAGALAFSAAGVRAPGLRSSLPASYHADLSAGDALRAKIPTGIRVTVGDMQFNGRGNSNVSEAEVRSLLEKILEDAKGPVTGGTVDVAAVRRALNTNPTTEIAPVAGVTFLPVYVVGKNGVSFGTQVPIASTDVAAVSEDLDSECRSAAESRIAAAANHVADWARL